MTLLSSWKNAHEVKRTTSVAHAVRQVEKWAKPSPGRYKCNINVSR